MPESETLGGPDFLVLVQKAIDGELAEDELAALQAALKSSPEHRDTFTSMVAAMLLPALQMAK